MAERLRVLYADDEVVDQLAIARLIRRQQLPWRLVIATSKGDTLDKLRSMDFDVALLDYQLGDGTGLEVLPHLGPVPGIIITGYGSEQVAAEALERGAYGYVIKTGDREHLNRLPLVVEKVLERRQRERLVLICRDCKRVRDHRGTWEALEEAVGAELTYDLCPACQEKIPARRAGTSPGEGLASGSAMVHTISVLDAYRFNYPGEDGEALLRRMERDGFPPTSACWEGERLLITRLRPDYNLYRIRGTRWEDLYVAVGIGLGMQRANPTQVRTFLNRVGNGGDPASLRAVQACPFDGPEIAARKLFPPLSWPVGQEFVGVG